MVSDRVRNRDKLHLWLWRPLEMADLNPTTFGLVPLRTSDQSAVSLHLMSRLLVFISSIIVIIIIIIIDGLSVA